MVGYCLPEMVIPIRKRSPLVINIIGQKFGRLLVVKDIGRNQGSNVLWECICDCGATVFAKGSDLRKGKIKSCGCYKKEFSHRPLNIDNFNIIHCLRCNKSIREYKSTGYKRRFCSQECYSLYVRDGQECAFCHQPITVPKSHHRIYCSKHCQHEASKLKYGESHKHEIIYGYKEHARKRGLSFELSQQDIDNLFSGQCYWCGAEPQNGIHSSRQLRNNGSFVYNGIDRVDSRLGYTKENSVSCCMRCNSMKREYSKEEFLNRVKRIGDKWQLWLD